MKTMSALRATATIVAAIVLALLTVQGTLATWSETATSESQTVQSADFVVNVGGQDQRLSSGKPVTVVGPSGLMPGTSKTTSIVVTNATDAGGAFAIGASADVPTATGDLAPYLRTSIALGQGGSCDTVRQGSTLELAKGASGTFCLGATLQADTPVAFGGSGASVAFTLDILQR